MADDHKKSSNLVSTFKNVGVSLWDVLELSAGDSGDGLGEAVVRADKVLWRCLEESRVNVFVAVHCIVNGLGNSRLVGGEHELLRHGFQE